MYWSNGPLNQMNVPSTFLRTLLLDIKLSTLPPPPHALCLPTCIRKLPPYPSFYTIPILLILSKYCLHKLHVTCSSQELHVSIMYMYKLSNCQCRKLFYRVKREENTWRHIKMTYLFV